MTDSDGRTLAAARHHAVQSWSQSLVVLVALLLWVLVLYRDTGLAMVRIWAVSETFTHAFLVPPIVLWLIWRRRHVLAELSPRVNRRFLLALAGVALAWLLGDLAVVNTVTQLALTAMLVLVVPAVLGTTVARVIVFPLGFLFFAVPVGEFLMPQLMTWTADFTVFALRLSGVPVYREGLQFVIPSGNWSVVEACSGVRYLIASLTVGTLFAYLNYRSNRRRALFVIVSILVPVFANWLRAYFIVMLGHLSGNKLAVGVDHLIYGWLFFGVVIMLMFIIGARWADSAAVDADHEAFGLAAAGKTSASLTGLWGHALGVAALLWLPALALWAMEDGAPARTVVFKAPAVLAEGWHQAARADTGFEPNFQNPSAKINAQYRHDGPVVGLYLGYYRHQDDSRKLVSSNNSLVLSNDLHWAEVARGSQVVALAGQRVSLKTAELRGSAVADQVHAARLLVWQVYWINGTLTSSDYLAKVYGAWYRLIGRDDDAAVMMVYTAKDQNSAAEVILESFLSDNYEAINALLMTTQQTR